MGDIMEKIKNSFVINLLTDVFFIAFGVVGSVVLINQALYSFSDISQPLQMLKNVFSTVVVNEPYLKQLITYLTAGLLLGITATGIAFLQNDIEKKINQRNEII